ncbi:hypothetical protein [Salinicoccus sp. Marseille-QA3877]
MWAWITLFLIIMGVALIGMGQTTEIVIVGIIGFLAGVTTMVLGVEKEESQ